MVFDLGLHFWERLRVLDRIYRILAGAEPFRPRHIQNCLDPLRQSFCCFVLLGPDRRQAHHHFRLTDAVDRHPPDFGKGIVAQRVDPLLTVLCVLPGRQLCDMNPLRDVFECRNFLACVEARIKPLLGHSAVSQRPLTRLWQRHDVCTTQPEIGPEWCTFSVLLPFRNRPHNPAPGSGRINHKIQTVPVAMPSRPEILHQLLRQLSRKRRLYRSRKAYSRYRKKTRET